MALLRTPALTACIPAGPVVVLLLLCLLPLVGAPPHTNPNEVIRVEHAVAMALSATHDLRSAAEVYGVSEDAAIRDGRLLSDKAPGLALLAVPPAWIAAPVLTGSDRDLPPYWPLRHLLTALLAALPAALAAWVVARTASSGAPGSDRRALSGFAAALALATPLVTYGTVLLGHALAAGLVTLAWMPLLNRWRESSAVGPRTAWWCGAAAGFAVGTEYPTAILVLVLGVAVVLDRRSATAARASFVVGTVVGVLPMLIVHHFAFGAPWRTGYSFKVASDFQQIIDRGVFGISAPSWEGLLGVLVSAQRGILWYSPVLAVAAVGMVCGARSRRPGTLVLAVATAVYFAFAAGFVDWRGGWGAAARHLTPVVPLLLLLTVDGLRSLCRTTVGAVITVGLTTVAVTHTVLTVVVTPFFPVEFDAPLTQLVVPSIASGIAAPTVVGVLTGVPDLAVWALAGLTALTVVIASLVAFTGRRRLTVTVATLTLVGHVLLLAAGSALRPVELEPYRLGLVHYLGLTDDDHR